MENTEYGSRAWMESQYAFSTQDPWGLDWRASQQYRYWRMLSAVRRHQPLTTPPLAILDIGCATGGFTAMLGSLHAPGEGGTLVGIDIATQAVARARVKFPVLRFECMALDECARQFAGSADVVTCMEVLYYLPQAQRTEAVQQLKRLLKPGGLLLASSMVASAPYFSNTRLNALIASELRVIEAGVLCLKPLVLYEKLLMKIRKLAGLDVAGRTPGFCYASVDRVQRWANFLPSRLGQSHAYVVARND